MSKNKGYIAVKIISEDSIYLHREKNIDHFGKLKFKDSQKDTIHLVFLTFTEASQLKDWN